MKKQIVFLIIFLFMTACFGAQTDNQADVVSTGTVGTIVLNPKKSVKSIFCDFEDKIYTLKSDFSMPDEKAIFESSSKVTKEVHDLLRQMPREEYVVETNVAMGWSLLEDFGLVVANAIYAKNPDGFTVAEQSLILDESYNFLDTQDQWTIQYSTYGEGSEYKKIYFVQTQTNKIQGYYIYKTDDDGVTDKGMLVFVNPKSLEGVLTNGRRLLVMVFDFTNPLENRFVVKFDRVSKEKGSLAGQVFMQCDEIFHNCIVEHQEISSKVPLREIKTPLVRYEWMEEAAEICVASMDYRLGSLEPRVTFEYDMVAHTLDVDACSIETPAWGDHVFTKNDFLIRYDDAKPFGGTVKDIYIDGVSKVGWEAYLTPERIDSLLNPGGE